MASNPEASRKCKIPSKPAIPDRGYPALIPHSYRHDYPAVIAPPFYALCIATRSLGSSSDVARSSLNFEAITLGITAGPQKPLFPAPPLQRPSDVQAKGFYTAFNKTIELNTITRQHKVDNINVRFCKVRWVNEIVHPVHLVAKQKFRKLIQRIPEVIEEG
ncbi:uncharacterized protein N7515_000567 [Penicillium bovifimosum]|uniref:Uncharacterized protein n=1 Tax=Penicillium bovifimosum TaxID=126998 RepID=A0A9W9LBP2_9EURO|nr:uncharacterized protein N7515_000567 [Penicillium bovifimosum]KAJ5146003.1 hypothetical protein N7515_000567 [Penicillium bovifimosum]